MIVANAGRDRIFSVAPGVSGKASGVQAQAYDRLVAALAAGSFLEAVGLVGGFDGVVVVVAGLVAGFGAGVGVVAGFVVVVMVVPPVAGAVPPAGVPEAPGVGVGSGAGSGSDGSGRRRPSRRP